MLDKWFGKKQPIYNSAICEARFWSCTSFCWSTTQLKFYVIHDYLNNLYCNDIIGVIYRHPKMDVNNYIDDKLDILIHNLSFEKNKKIFIVGDFNFVLLKISNNTETVNF